MRSGLAGIEGSVSYHTLKNSRKKEEEMESKKGEVREKHALEARDPSAGGAHG
jgi:hypothetical protein